MNSEACQDVSDYFFAQEIWVQSTFQVRGHSYEFLCLT